MTTKMPVELQRQQISTLKAARAGMRVIAEGLIGPTGTPAGTTKAQQVMLREAATKIADRCDELIRRVENGADPTNMATDSQTVGDEMASLIELWEAISDDT